MLTGLLKTKDDERIQREKEEAAKQKKLNQSKNYTSYERVPLSCFGMGRAQKDARMLFSPASERPAETR